MPLDDPMDREVTAERPALMEQLQQQHDVVQSFDERSVLEVMPGYQQGDLGADPGELAEHRRSDAQFGRAARRLGLAAAIDAQQFGPLAGHADDIFVAADGDDVVAIRDATGERPDAQQFVRPGRHPPNDGFNILAHPERLNTLDYLDGVKLILVRHGATEWSSNGRHTGTTDLALTAQGRVQARDARPKVTARIGADQPSANWSSPLQRARTTAEIVVGDGAFALDDRLREFDYGDYEGLTTTEIRQRAPGWTVWDGCPSGETVADVAGRVDSFLTDLRAHGAPVSVLFAHGHLLRILAARAIEQPGAFGKHLALDTASVSEVMDQRDGPAITLWNDVSHCR